MSLPDYIINNKNLNSIPTKDKELLDKNDNTIESILLSIAFVIHNEINSTDNNFVVIKPEFLKKLNYQMASHENIIREFFTNKGYQVTVDNDNSIKFEW